MTGPTQSGSTNGEQPAYRPPDTFTLPSPSQSIGSGAPPQRQSLFQGIPEWVKTWGFIGSLLVLIALFCWQLKSDTLELKSEIKSMVTKIDGNNTVSTGSINRIEIKVEKISDDLKGIDNKVNELKYKIDYNQSKSR